MKKTVLSLLFVGAGILSVSAQHTITSANAPAPGNVNIQANDTLPVGITPGNGGPSQTWDYSSLKNVRQDTTPYVSPSATPYASSFPNATVAVYSIVTGAGTYLETSSSALKLDGGVLLLPGSATPIISQNNPPRIIMKYPTTFMTSFKDSSKSEATFSGASFGVDSIRFRNKTVAQDTADGYGSVKNPQTTYASSLRMKGVSFSYDTIDIKIPFAGWSNYRKTITKTVKYEWYAQGKTFPVVTLIMDTLETIVTGAKYWVDPSLVTSISGRNNLSEGVTLYPNPVSDELTVITSGNTGKLEVFDVTGRSTGLFRLTGSPSLKINTSGYSKGMYLYKLTDEKGVLIKAGKFNVAR